MNGKLIALLIRSNALMIEALKMSDANAQMREGGPYAHDSSEFNNLVLDCELLAKEAEEFEDVQLQSHVTITGQDLLSPDQQDLIRKVVEQTPQVSPMIPISPAHLPDPLRLQDVEIGRVFHGKFEGNGKPYTALIRITNLITDVMGPQLALVTMLQTIEGKGLIPFERRLSEDTFVKEFVSWEK